MKNDQVFSEGNIALVTGAADGIGLAASLRFARMGLSVVMVDVNPEKLSAAFRSVEEVASKGACIEVQTLDVSDYEKFKDFSSNFFSKFDRIDILMNNAGRSGPTGAFDGLNTWKEIVDVNLWGVIHGVTLFTQAMIDQGGPAIIINTGSKQGITNPPGNPAYNVSKAGVKVATESLAYSLRNIEGCEVSAHLLVPGFTYTGLIKAMGVSEKPEAAWSADQVVEYLIENVKLGSFYIICPDNDVSEKEDAKRITWSAGDLVHRRPALSRWHPEHEDEFKAFEIPQAR